VRVYVAGLPSAHRWLCSGFFILLFAGQLAHEPRRSFPFPTWAMYGEAEHPDALVFYECRGLDARQEMFTIDVARLLPSLTTTGATTKLKALAKGALSHPDAAKRQVRQRRLTEFLQAVGRLHNRVHLQRQISRLALVRCTLALRDRSASELQRESVWQVELDPGGVS